ncbi:hypothetical protein [Microscilla marina]|uniref:Uncharacterized protein n=1 Tax=Microscilla marina ATCC 23134 TaxID=313606 RepID=A1ZNA4_MICM2|nr:hypothetical protein [Microscilla marina]EAY28285.1 hypothetical protein M23134_03546 [Microscilla marina ATCC 23134]
MINTLINLRKKATASARQPLLSVDSAASVLDRLLQGNTLEATQLELAQTEVSRRYEAATRQLAKSLDRQDEASQRAKYWINLGTQLTYRHFSELLGSRNLVWAKLGTEDKLYACLKETIEFDKEAEQIIRFASRVYMYSLPFAEGIQEATRHLLPLFNNLVHTVNNEGTLELEELRQRRGKYQGEGDLPEEGKQEEGEGEHV